MMVEHPRGPAMAIVKGMENLDINIGSYMLWAGWTAGDTGAEIDLKSD